MIINLQCSIGWVCGDECTNECANDHGNEWLVHHYVLAAAFATSELQVGYSNVRYESSRVDTLLLICDPFCENLPIRVETTTEISKSRQ